MKNMKTREVLLPKQLQENEEMPNEAKVVLNELLNLCQFNSLAKEQGCVICPNNKLRDLTQLGKSEMMTAIGWLDLFGLVDREAGKTWQKGTKRQASKYTIHFDKLVKPLEQRTFEELFEKHLDNCGNDQVKACEEFVCYDMSYDEEEEMAKLQQNIHRMIANGC